MKELISTVLAIALILGVVKLAQRCHERPDSGPVEVARSESEQQPAGESSVTAPTPSRRACLKCAIVISAEDRARGDAIAGLNSLGLITPIGEMLATELPRTARQYFQSVEVIDDARQAPDVDVILKPGEWNYDEDTGYELTGLALVYASGHAFVSGRLGLNVRLRNGDTFSLDESVHKVTIPCGGFVPIAMLRKIMTDATRQAIAVAADSLMQDIARDMRVQSLGGDVRS
jgi:hypothetical protein